MPILEAKWSQMIFENITGKMNLDQTVNLLTFQVMLKSTGADSYNQLYLLSQSS